MSKKLQEKQRRRLAEQMRRDQQRKATRRSNMITIGIALAIAAAVTIFIINERGADEPAPAPEGVPAAEGGCDEIEEHKEEGNQHVNAGTDVEYETSPPTSGDHWEAPADHGFYPEEVPEESLVHNLEHGQIVIWYDPDATTETRDNLDAFAESANEGEPTGPIIAAPYPDIPEGKTFVMTAWTASQACSAYSLDAINAFREKYQGRGPEPIAPTFENT